MIELPPKRFELCSDHKYDSIRFYPWFWRLEKRRKDLPTMRAAFYEIMKDGRTVSEVSAQWGLKRPEMSKCFDFMIGKGQVCRLKQNVRNAAQSALDEAYRIYCLKEGKTSFQQCILDTARFYSMSRTKMIELWETDPFFYPTVYQQNKAKCLSNYEQPCAAPDTEIPVSQKLTHP